MRRRIEGICSRHGQSTNNSPEEEYNERRGHSKDTEDSDERRRIGSHPEDRQPDPDHPVGVEGRREVSRLLE